MKHPRTRSLVCAAAAAALGLLIAPAADAGVSKRVSVRLHNDTPDTPMTCSVHKIVTNSNGVDVPTRIARWSVKPKNDRPSSVRNKPQEFSVRVARIGRRIDRTDIYPRLQLTCEGAQNTENHSPEWNHQANSFDTHRFIGSCRSGAYCSLRFERK